MRVDWLIPCEFATVSNGLVTIVTGGFDTVQVQEIPGPVVVNLAFRGSGLPDAKNHELRLSVHDPSMDEALDPLTFPFELKAPPLARAGWEVNAILPLQVIFQANAEGPYTITAEIDGSTSTSISIWVAHA